MKRRVSRIGITMREASATDYHEPRDALARDWGAWMTRNLPEVAWLPVPNLAEGIVRFAEQWQLDGLILSGGEDPGGAPVRDRTEACLLDAAEARGWPVLGVCRGAQLLWQRGGGQLVPVPGHVDCRSEVRWTEGARTALDMEGVAEVRCYHRFGLAGSSDAGEPWAYAKDGTLEAFGNMALGRFGLLWHPERGAAGCSAGAVRRFFGLSDRPLIRTDEPRSD